LRKGGSVSTLPDPVFESFHRQTGYRVRLEWGVAGVRLLRDLADIVVIVDVLSFSTAVSVAVDRGASVIPFRFDSDRLAAFAASVGATHVADRDRSAPGPTLSPASLLDLPSGARLVLPSPNGSTCAALAAEAGCQVVTAGLRNATAVGRYAIEHGSTIAVIPAGERWSDGSLRPAVEDFIGAGAVVAAMTTVDAGATGLSPEARMAMAAFEDARDDLLPRLVDSVSGRELIGRGFESDVAIAAELDRSSVVPVLADGAFAGR